MDFHLQNVEKRPPVEVEGKTFKIERSVEITGRLAAKVDYAALDFYSRADHTYVRVVIYDIDGGSEERHWRASTIIDVEPEALKRVKQFLHFAQELGIAATCLANMIKGGAPHHAPLSK